MAGLCGLSEPGEKDCKAGGVSCYVADDLSNPVRWEQDVPRSPAAPDDNRVALRPRMHLVDKTTKGDMFVVTNFTLKEYREIRWC